MQPSYPESFDRDMACMVSEWLAWLPGAVGSHTLQCDGARASVTIGAGRLELRWRELEPRVIALLRLPRLGVCFRFQGVAETERAAFMRYFDLYMQRGGG